MTSSLLSIVPTIQTGTSAYLEDHSIFGNSQSGSPCINMGVNIYICLHIYAYIYTHTSFYVIINIILYLCHSLCISILCVITSQLFFAFLNSSVVQASRVAIVDRACEVFGLDTFRRRHHWQQGIAIDPPALVEPRTSRRQWCDWEMTGWYRDDIMGFIFPGI